MSSMLVRCVFGSLLLGCSGHSDSVGTFVGSCGIQNAGSTMPQCVDYGDGDTVDTIKGMCGSTYTMTPCPSANRKGHCIFTNNGISTYRVSYYYDWNPHDQCELNMGTPFSN